MKKWLKQPLVKAYLIAFAVWILLFLVGTAKSFRNSTQGNGEEIVVPLNEVQFVALVEQKPDKAIPEGDWLVSSDSDPQIRWNCSGRYIEQIQMKMKSLWPTGAVVLYYRTVGQKVFSPMQMVYAQQQRDGSYLFDIGGKRLEEIRIDPASQGGVILQLEEIRTISKGIHAIVPSWQQLALLLGLPPLILAIWQIALKDVFSYFQSRGYLNRRKFRLFLQ